MATKKTTAVQSESYKIVDTDLEGKDSKKLRFGVYLPDTQDKANKYHMALKASRGIPSDLDNINLLDPMYAYVYENFPHLKPKGNEEEVDKQVRLFYEEKSNEAYRDAMVLAVIGYNENQFEDDPIPYDDTVQESLPGLVSSPPTVYNLNNTSERRLKQAMDFLARNVSILTQFNREFRNATIAINNYADKSNTDEDGFSSL